VTELLEGAKLGDLTLGLVYGGGTGQRFGNGFAVDLIGEAFVGTMNGLAGLMTPAVGLAAASRRAGDGTRSEIAESGNLLSNGKATGF